MMRDIAFNTGHVRHVRAAARFALRREETDCCVVGRPISNRNRLRKFFVAVHFPGENGVLPESHVW